MMTRIDIRNANAIHQDDVLVLAVTGSSQGEDMQLVLSVDERPGDQDLGLGLTGVHLEWNGQAKGGYGLVESAVWTGGDLEIATCAAAWSLGVPRRMLLVGAADHLEGDPRRVADRLLTHV